MQILKDIKAEAPSLSSEVAEHKDQTLAKHRLSKKILFRSSKGIISYFSFYQPLVAEKNEDMTSFSLLCHQLEQQKVFELDITNIQYPLKKFLLFVNALKKNKSIKILTLTDNKIRWQKLAKLCLSFKNITFEELRLKGNRLTDNSMFQLKGILKGNKNLRVIDFSSNEIENSGFKALCSVLKDMPLEELNLRSNRIRSTFYLDKALTNNTSLRILNLTINQIRNLASQLSPMFQNIPLEELYLCCNKLTHNSMPSLKKALENNRTLKVLDVSFNKIWDEGLINLCSIFKNMPLEKLILFETDIGEKSMLPLKKSLENNRTLKVLELFNNRITDKGLAILCPIFKNMPLEKLALSHTNIGDGSMLPLRKSLENNRTLKVLKLSHNMIGDKGLAALCPILKNMPLEILDFESNHIENVPPEFYSFLKNSLVKTVNFSGNALTETSIKGIALALKDNMHIKCLSGISENKELIYTFYPLMDLLISLGHKLSAENAQNDLHISTKNFPRSLRALNNTFDSHIPVVDLVDIISSYTFSIDTLSTLVES